METNTPQGFMEKKMQELTVALTPSPLEYAEIRREYIARTGTDNTYVHEEVWKELIRRRTEKHILKNVTFDEAQAFAEPLRIAHPDQHVNIYDDRGNFIGNTTWNDQIKMFWDYPVFTPEGEILVNKRREEAALIGITASWE